MWLNDPKTKEPSVTVTLLVLGFVVCTSKLIFSGITLGGIQLSPFTGIDYASAVGALGGIYAWRQGQTLKSESKDG